MSLQRHITVHRLHLPALMLTMGCLLPLVCSAAPTTDAPGTAEANPVSSAPLGPAGMQPTGRNSDTRTIDLLVEMQQPTAGIQFNERAGRPGARDVQPRQAQANPAAAAQTQQRNQIEAPPTPPSGLFGTGATPTVQSGSQASHERASLGDAMPPRASGRPSSDVPPELKRWLQWPREFIEYARENRAFIAACAAMLLVVGWTGSMMFSRRRG